MQPRDAATVMLVRDAPDLQVFLLRRNVRSVFVGGAYVFPGGAVDPGDRARELADRATGVPAGGPVAAPFRFAAIRESFEEGGVLLARDARTGAPVDVEDPAVVTTLDAARRALIGGERTFLDIVVEHGVVLDAGSLHPFARWITPPGAPRRYDTWFFVAAAPEGHAYVHDADETVESAWIRPTDALDAARRREIELVYPTFRSLQALARFDTSTEVLDAIRAAWRDRADPLEPMEPGRGWQLRLDPDGPGRPGADALEDALEHSTTTSTARSGGA